VRRDGIHGCTSQPSRPHRRAAGTPVRPAPLIGTAFQRRAGAGEEGQDLAAAPRTPSPTTTSRSGPCARLTEG